MRKRYLTFTRMGFCVFVLALFGACDRKLTTQLLGTGAPNYFQTSGLAMDGPLHPKEHSAELAALGANSALPYSLEITESSISKKVKAPERASDGLASVVANSIPYSLEVAETAMNTKVWPGAHSFAAGVYGDRLVVVGGRTNGLHNFPEDHLEEDAFPKEYANDHIYVLNLTTGVAHKKSINGLPRNIAIQFRSTNTQYTTDGPWFYIVGGYGENPDSDAQGLITLPYISVIDIQALIERVEGAGELDQAFADANIAQISAVDAPDLVTPGQTVKKQIRITGGELHKLGDYFLLVFGHTFDGNYTRNGASFQQVYANVVHALKLKPARLNGMLQLKGVLQGIYPDPNVIDPNQQPPDYAYHRRDLTVAPAKQLTPSGAVSVITAYGGAFKNDIEGFVTPIYIGTSKEAGNLIYTLSEDKNATQFLSQYTCPAIPLFSESNNEMYTVFFGGISSFYWKNGALHSDPVDLPNGIDGLPFINSVSSLKVTLNGEALQTSQYLHSTLLFPPADAQPTRGAAASLLGANTYFVPNPALARDDGVILLDALKGPTDLGWLVGGIASTTPYRQENSTFASDKVYKVTLNPNAPDPNAILLEHPK